MLFLLEDQSFVPNAKRSLRLASAASATNSPVIDRDCENFRA
jgi:hypothetical protein